MRPWRPGHTLALLLFVVAIVVAGIVLPHWIGVEDDGDPTHIVLWTWLGIAALLALFIVVAGHGIVGLWRGALVDDRNRMSLARLQLVLWTVLVLSAFIAAALANVGAGEDDALEVSLPEELWLAMGISLTSLAGSVLVRNTKEQTVQVAQLSAQQRDRMDDYMRARGIASAWKKGEVVGFGEPKNATWDQLFAGDGEDTTPFVDLSKVQMFFFTILLVLAYAFALGDQLYDVDTKIEELPDLDSGSIVLLGISHAGYLTKKAVKL